MNCPRRLLFVVLMITAPALATEAAFGEFSIEIAPNSFEERCVQLEAGQSIRYRFKADRAVDFNIHHHRGNEVVYPVKQANVRARNSRFRAKHADAYCLMWENRGKALTRVAGLIERSGASSRSQ